MKIQRPGYSESTLLCLDYILKNHICELDEYHNSIVNQSIHKFLCWLFTTSGLYDVTISSTGMKELKSSKKNNKTNLLLFAEDLYEHTTVKRFISMYVAGLKNSDVCKLLLHKMTPEFHTKGFVRKFKESLYVKSETFPWALDNQFYYNYMEGKTVLVVNSFASLCAKQYKSGNLNKIDSSFPKLKNIIY